MNNIRVSLRERSYDIYVGGGAVAQAADFITNNLGVTRAAVVSDRNVWNIHGGRLSAALDGVDFIPVIVDAGEHSKSFQNLEMLLEAFANGRLKRNEPVVAFGGGVVGDLAGYAAASYMRGVPFLQIPTTLLAQVDSSVGGKVAVNLKAGKNLAGSFYQPSAVFADTSLLRTLPERELNVGLAEAVKHAAIGEARLTSLLSDRANLFNNIDEIVALNCAFKAAVVSRDEHEHGERMYLNFGHTFGHAIEILGGFERHSHGEAVAQGMALAARTGVLLGLTPPETERELLSLMDAAGLSYNCTENLADIIPLMAGDKKNQGNSVTLILLEAFGKPIVCKITQDDLRKVILCDR